jgi:hypothetical protein
VCVFITAVPIIKLFARGEGDSGGHVLRDGTREEPGTLTQGGALFSLVPLVWESNPKLQGGWCPTTSPSGCKRQDREVCVFYYCRTYYKAVRVGGGRSRFP